MNRARLQRLLTLVERGEPSAQHGSLNMFRWHVGGIADPQDVEAVDHIGDAIGQAESLYRQLGFTMGYLNRRELDLALDSLEDCVDDIKGLRLSIERSIKNVKEQQEKEAKETTPGRGVMGP